MADNRSVIAEHYLTLIAKSPGGTHEGMYVRLADRYGVPFGRIVALTGLPSTVVAAHLEGAQDAS